MELIEDDLAVCFRHVVSDRFDVRVLHVYRNRLDAADLFRCQGFPEAVETTRFLVRSRMRLQLHGLNLA